MKKSLLKVIYAFSTALLFGVARAGTVTYVYTDPQGTPLAEADANGNITATFDYRPYGGQELGAPKNGPGYTGHVNDPDSGLVYMQARYYDPAVGRFLSIDPAFSLDSFNRYSYVGNNPITKIDPTGEVAQLNWVANNRVTLTVTYIVLAKDGAHLRYTPAQINQAFARNFSGSVNVGGTNVQVTARAVEANSTSKVGTVNVLTVVPDTAGVTQSGRSETANGDHVTIGEHGEQAASTLTISHEFGHVGYAGDQYKDGIDANGNKVSQDSPDSNIMRDLSGQNGANGQTLREIINSPKNVNTCQPGVKAPSGGC
jgi:RHS repeat-associated protein